MDKFPPPTNKSPLDIMAEQAATIEREQLQEKLRKEQKVHEQRSKQKLWQLFWRIKWGLVDLAGKASRPKKPMASKNSKAHPAEAKPEKARLVEAISLFVAIIAVIPAMNANDPISV